jgi:hypothetical protein
VSRDEKNGTERISTKLLLGLIGVIGVIFGSVATYLGSNQLQDTQFERADEQAAAEAKGTARVLQGIFRSADDVFVASLRDCSYAYGLKDLETTIPYTDRKVLASRLSPEDWSAVDTALERLKRQFDRSRVEPFTPQYAVSQLHDLRDALFKGQEALADLGETSVKPPEDQAVGKRC